MSKKYFYLSILFLSIAIAKEDLYLWDLGLKINNNTVNNIKKEDSIRLNSSDSKHALIADRYLEPTRNKMELITHQYSELNNLDYINLNYKTQIKAGKRYLISNQFLNALTLFEMVDYSQLNKKEKKELIWLHLNSLMSLGHYEKTMNLLLDGELEELNDDLLFLLGTSSLKVGKKKVSLNAFEKIIVNHPSSAYYNIAKIQANALRH